MRSLGAAARPVAAAVTAVIAASGLLACAMPRASAPSVTTVKSAEFLDGGERGFVIGRVDGTRDEAYFAALGKTGATLARIFLPLPRDASGRRYVLADSAVRELRNILKFAQDEHLKLVIVGDFTGVQQPDFWTDASLRASFVATWASIAGALGNDPAIAGLDLLNEPNPQSPTGSLSDMQLNWRLLAQQAIVQIRARHVAVPIVFEPVAGAGTLGFRNLTPLDDPQIVYSLHFYTPLEITHQHVDAGWTRTIPYPAGEDWQLGSWDPQLGVTRMDRQRLELELRDVIEFQRRFGVPILVGEFSCVRWAPRGSAARYVGDLLEIFAAHGWSWTYHEYRGWPGWDPEIASEDRRVERRSADAPIITLLRAHMRRPAT